MGLIRFTVQRRFVPRCAFFQNSYSSNACIMVLPKLTFVLLYSPFSFPSLRFVLAPLCDFMEDLITVVIVEVFNMLSFCLNNSIKCLTTLKTKHNCPSLWLIDSKGARCHEWISVFPYRGKKSYLSNSHLSIFNTAQWGEHMKMQSLLAY